MTFGFGLSDELKKLLPKLAKRNKVLLLALNKKIAEIIASDDLTIDHYKNLRHDMSDYKRVHVGGSFVLFFHVLKKQKFVLFQRLEHHDDAYKR